MAKDYDVLDDFQDNVFAVLKKQGIEAAVAKIAAETLREHFRVYWGGQMVYFTKTVNISARDRDLYAKYTGDNVSELAREFGISEQWAYRVIDTVRKKEKAGIRLL